jgi:hypothetical protein
VRVQLTSWPLIVQVQPVPVADVGVSPAGVESVTVTVLPSVAAVPPLVTVRVKLPVPPRVNVAALTVLDKVNEGTDASAVLTVTEPEADEPSPPPTTLAVLVNDAAALLATDTATVIDG